MAVDDMRLRGAQAEFRQDAADRRLILQKAVIGILCLLVRLLLRQEIPFEGGHLILAEQRGILVQPDIPHQIAPLFALRLIDCHKALADVVVKRVVQRAAAVRFPVNLHCLEGSVLIERHAAVIEEVVVVNLIKASSGEQEFHMLLQPLAVDKGPLQPLHDLRLLLCEGIGIFGIHGGEIRVQKGVLFTVYRDHAPLKIDPVQEISFFQMKFRMAADNLALCLKLDDGNGLVHL